jgi:hypothetical protein
MALHNDIWAIINSSNVSVRKLSGGKVSVRDSVSFKGLPLRRQQEINDFTYNEELLNVKRVFKEVDTLEYVKRRSGKIVPLMLNNYKTNTPLTKTVNDSIMGPGAVVGSFGPSAMGGISNNQTMNGFQGQDPMTFSRSQPNLWISPAEAASIYSQKGIPETIIRKKSQSILLNGVKIKNPHLNPSQLDEIQEDMLRTGLANKIADCLRDALTYGGALLFPMFKHDTPLTLGLPIDVLAKYGVVGKHCIDWMVALDRWNTVHIPNWNPTAKDFLNPQSYYIPFLGSDVNGQRCARIITAPQTGYWGAIMTMGWGISDIPGWIESVYNYYNVMSAIPTMINQMSILARTFNVDGPMATEGANILDDIDFEETIKVRQMSPNNPISLDVVGSIQAIQRDFKEVPNLVRLIRQDVGGRATIPEELLWSSERGAFSSGDTTDSALERQQESIKYIHKDAEYQLKNVAMLEVINALGLDRKVLAALPYTTIEFSNITLANVKEKAEVGKNSSKAFFDTRAAGMPLDYAAQLMEEFSDHEFSVPNELREQLIERQKVEDTRTEEKHQKEMELLQAQIDLTNEQVEHVGDAAAGIGSVKSGGKNPLKAQGYSKLEQRQKEKTRGTATRKEGMQKAENKKL